MKRIIKLSALCAAILLTCTVTAAADTGGSVKITIDTSRDRKAISPYIYGINTELINKDTTVRAVRSGGNRSSAYNWETNASNAGSDWRFNSDNYYLQGISKEKWETPGAVALDLSERCGDKGGAYSLVTLQMVGYVAADMDGEVTEAQAAPSERWNRVELTKGSEFSMTPDPDDGVVYMDEYVNYLVNTLGDSSTYTGIKGYSLDNEPSLWKWTHARIHPEQTYCAEILEKSVTMSRAVKSIDPGAEIFGPALFGYGAFTDFAGAGDWTEIKTREPEYRWFIDYYLDEMRKAEEESGTRLLDVLDIHYYTEAKGECGERSCKHYSRKGCVEARLNSTRSLWDETYREDSWITDTGAEFLPLLPNIQQSIDTYYPGTKLAITEYDFGGSYDICGGIAEADALGIFAKYGVYFATLFANEADYQCAAIDLYTNYDGSGSHFGDTLVYCETDDIERSTAYASVEGDNNDVITLVVSNKSFTDRTKAEIQINGGEEYSYVHLYGLNSFAPQVFDMTDSNSAVTISGDTITYDMEPETVSLLVIAKDGNALVSADVAKPSTKDSKGSFHGWIYGVIGGVAALAAGAAALILMGRKKRSS